MHTLRAMVQLLCLCLAALVIFGCGNPQQELWDEYYAHLKSQEFESALGKLEEIKRLNPEAKDPTDSGSVDGVIKQTQKIIESQQALKRLEESAKQFDKKKANPPLPKQAAKKSDPAKPPVARKLSTVALGERLKYAFSSNRKHVAYASSNGLTVQDLTTANSHTFKNTETGLSIGQENTFEAGMDGALERPVSAIDEEFALSPEGLVAVVKTYDSLSRLKRPEIDIKGESNKEKEDDSIEPLQKVPRSTSLFGVNKHSGMMGGVFAELVVLDSSRKNLVRNVDRTQISQMGMPHIGPFAVASEYILAAVGGGLGDTRYLAIFSLKDGQLQRILRGHKESITSITVSPSGGFAVTTGNDHLAFLWNLQDGGELQIFDDPSGHRAEVIAAAFSPDEKQLITGGRDLTAIVWGIPSGKPIKKIPIGHFDSVEYLKEKADAISREIENQRRMQAGEDLDFSSPPPRTQIVNVDFSPGGDHVLISLRPGLSKDGTKINVIHNNINPVNPVIIRLSDGTVVDPERFSQELTDHPIEVMLHADIWSPRFFSKSGDAIWIPTVSTTRERGEDILKHQLTESSISSIPDGKDHAVALLSTDQITHTSPPSEKSIVYDNQDQKTDDITDDIFEGVLGFTTAGGMGEGRFALKEQLEGYSFLVDEDGTKIETSLLNILFDDRSFDRNRTPIAEVIKDFKRYVGKTIFFEAYITDTPLGVDKRNSSRAIALEQVGILSGAWDERDGLLRPIRGLTRTTTSNLLNSTRWYGRESGMQGMEEDFGDDDFPFDVGPGFEQGNIENFGDFRDSFFCFQLSDDQKKREAISAGSAVKWKINPVNNLEGIGLGFPKSVPYSEKRHFDGGADEVIFNGSEVWRGKSPYSGLDARRTPLVAIPIRVIGEVMAVDAEMRNHLQARQNEAKTLLGQDEGLGIGGMHGPAEGGFGGDLRDQDEPEAPEMPLPKHLFVPYAFITGEPTSSPKTKLSSFAPQHWGSHSPERRARGADGFGGFEGMDMAEEMVGGDGEEDASQIAAFCYFDISRAKIIRTNLKSASANPQELAASIVQLMQQPAEKRAQLFLGSCNRVAGGRAESLKKLVDEDNFPVDAFGRTFASRNELIRAIEVMLTNLAPACIEFKVLKSTSKTATVRTSGNGKVITWQFDNQKGQWLVSDWTTGE